MSGSKMLLAEMNKIDVRVLFTHISVHTWRTMDETLLGKVSSAKLDFKFKFIYRLNVYSSIMYLFTGLVFQFDEIYLL